MEVLILVVCYNGARTIMETINSCLAAEKPVSLLAVDNGSTDSTLAILKSIHDNQLSIISAGYNSGLGAAFNVGIKAACDRGLQWLYILDQDSVLVPGCLEKLFQTAQDLLKHTLSVAAISPTVRCRAYPEIIHYPLKWNGKQFLTEVHGVGSAFSGAVQVDSPISSGTLYRVEALKAIGGFNESYFIDFVDHDCHLRLRKAGYTLWWEKKAVMFHQLGAIQRMTESGLWIEHEPFRYYYMARNMTEGHRRIGGLTSMLIFWREIARHIVRLRKNSHHPYIGIYYMLRGCIDAVIGKSGALASNP
jgi:rhamnosyltransferase